VSPFLFWLALWFLYRFATRWLTCIIYNFEGLCYGFPYFSFSVPLWNVGFLLQLWTGIRPEKTVKTNVCLAFYPDIYYQNKVITLHNQLVGIKQPMRKELAGSNQPINGQRDGSSTRPAKNFQSVSRLGQLQSSAAVPEDQTLQLYGPAQLVIFSILLLHGGDWWCVSSVDD
jgi:hypothetical protein